MSDHDITHKEISERVVSLEHKVDDLKKDTANLVAAFNAAQGAFLVLDFLAKHAKPQRFATVTGVAAAVA